MAQQPIGPLAAFRVGQIRAAIWKKDPPTQDDEPPYWITLERHQPTFQRDNNYTPLLECTDINPAILALRKADTYLRRAKQTEITGEFTSASHYAPERIP